MGSWARGLGGSRCEVQRLATGAPGERLGASGRFMLRNSPRSQLPLYFYIFLPVLRKTVPLATCYTDKLTLGLPAAVAGFAVSDGRRGARGCLSPICYKTRGPKFNQFAFFLNPPTFFILFFFWGGGVIGARRGLHEPKGGVN